MDPLTGNLIIRTNSDPRISYLPEAEAGLDSGRFYQRYDALAEEIDEDMAKGLKEHLDGLLIFAGLFAGVNSAFLALTLPLLSADPVDDTNTLLLQNNALLLYLALGRNDTLPGSSPTLPSSTFTPSYNILTINVLFSLSLAFALISAFIAVLGRQWLIYYRMRSGGGPDRERWEQLKRYLGAERWHLQFILDDILPSLLQIGLIIFCVSFILYIHMLHPTASHIVGIPLYVGLAMVFLSAICIIWDKFCPFQSPLSHFFLGCASAFRRCLGSRPNEDEEGQAYLQVTAVDRAISTSDDDLTLLYAAAHVITLDCGSSLGQLWNDGVFQRRMLELCTRSRERMSHLKLRDQTSTVAGSAARLFRAALAHVFLSLRNEATAESLHSLTQLCQSDGNTFSIWLIPSEEIQHTSPALVRASLAFSLLRSHAIAHHINSLSGYLAGYSDPLAGAGWDSLALMALAINLLVPDGQSPKKPDHYVQLDRLKQVYTGDPDGTQTTIGSIEKAILALTERRYAEQLDCDVVLANMLRSVTEIAFNQRHPALLTVDEKSKLLLFVEKQSRSSSAPHDLKIVASTIRRSMFTIAQNAFAVQGASRNFSVDSFRLLERFFEDLRIIRRTGGEWCIEDDLETLNLFAVVLQDLQSYGFEITEVSDTSRARNTPDQAFGAMILAFRDFRSEVDQTHLSIQRRNSRRRDPEIGWCHWRNSASPGSGLSLARKEGSSGKRKSKVGFRPSARLPAEFFFKAKPKPQPLEVPEKVPTEGDTLPEG